MGIWIFRAFVLSLITIGGYFYPPFRLNATYGAGAAFLAGALMMVLETRFRRAQFRLIWSAGLGLLAIHQPLRPGQYALRPQLRLAG